MVRNLPMGFETQTRPQPFGAHLCVRNLPMGFETSLHQAFQEPAFEFETSLWDLKLMYAHSRFTGLRSKPPYGI